MKVILWKRWCEIKKNPIKLILATFIPLILILIYTYVFKIDYKIQVLTIPTIASTFSTYIFYTVDDLSYAMWYSALGLKIKKIWYTNFLSLSIIEFVVSLITISIWSSMFDIKVEGETYITALLTIFIAMMLIALSTIHFYDNGKITIIIASVFAIINLLMVFVPLFLVWINDLERVCRNFSFVSFFILGACIIVMNNMNTESLVINTQGYISGYDKKFFNED